MQIKRVQWWWWIFLLAVLLPGLALAAAGDVIAFLETSRGQAAVGQATTWLLSVTPPEGVKAQIWVELADPHAWATPGGLPSGVVITNTHVFSLPAVPLAAGDATQVVVVRSLFSDTLHTQLVSGPQPIHVVDPAGLLVLELGGNLQTAKKGDEVAFTLHIRNGLPFDIAGLTISGDGAGLEWQPAPAPAGIAAGGQATAVLHALLTGPASRPEVQVGFSWQDDLGRDHSAEAVAFADPIQVSPEIWERLVASPLAQVCLGGFLTLIAAGLSGWLAVWLPKWLEKRAIQRSLVALLKLAVTNARYAAEYGVEMDVKPLEQAYQEKDLWYAAGVLRAQKKTLNVRDQINDMLDKGRIHNHTLHMRGGSHRADELKSAAERLNEVLKDFKD